MVSRHAQRWNDHRGEVLMPFVGRQSDEPRVGRPANEESISASELGRQRRLAARALDQNGRQITPPNDSLAHHSEKTQSSAPSFVNAESTRGMRSRSPMELAPLLRG